MALGLSAFRSLQWLPAARRWQDSRGSPTPSGTLTVVLPRSLISLDPHGPQSVEEATAVVSSHLL